MDSAVQFNHAAMPAFFCGKVLDAPGQDIYLDPLANCFNAGVTQKNDRARQMQEGCRSVVVVDGKYDSFGNRRQESTVTNLFGRDVNGQPDYHGCLVGDACSRGVKEQRRTIG